MAESLTPKLWVPGPQSQVKEVTSLAFHLTLCDLSSVTLSKSESNFSRADSSLSALPVPY